MYTGILKKAAVCEQSENYHLEFVLMKFLSITNIFASFYKHIHKIWRLTVERFGDVTSSRLKIGVMGKRKRKTLTISIEPREQTKAISLSWKI